MELKEIHASMQKAFADLQLAITAGDTERKTFGATTVETKSLVDKLNTRLDTLEADAERKAREVVVKTKDKPYDTPELRATEKFLRLGTKGGWQQALTVEEKAGYELATKALSGNTDNQGGIFVPEDFRLEIVRKIPSFANVGALVNRQNTSRDVLRWPSIPYATDDINTSGIVVTWEDDNDTVTETDFTMGSVAVPVKKMRALIKVPVELLEDSAVDIVGLLTDLMAQAFGIEEDRVLTNGSGPRRPEGFMTNADITAVNVGHATVLQYDGLMDFVYALPEQYAGNAKIMVKRTFVRDLRKVKDSTGQPLWQPSLTLGAPATFAGYPVVTNEHMPAIASAAKPAIFADFKQLYTVADRVGMTIKRLDELYAATDEVGFIARRRMGGKVTAPWAGKKLNMA